MTPLVASPAPRYRIATRLVAAAVIFCAVEGLVFHTGWYTQLLEARSSAGSLAATLANEVRRDRSGGKQIVAIGDSRMTLRARIANELTAETGYTFGVIATAGSTPRCWYYMLREVDPDARAYAAVVIGIDDYDDEDWEDYSNRLLDLYRLAPVLRVTDAGEFALSYPAWDNRWQAFRGTLLKGWTFRRDFQELMADSERRMSDARWVREDAGQLIYNFVWNTNSLAGLRVDWNAKQVYLPGATEDQIQGVRNVLFRGVAPQRGLRAAYHRRWLGRIVAHYRGSRTRLIFVRLPRGPVVRPYVVAKVGHTIRELGQRGQATLMDEHLFDQFEKPELFGDALHLNAQGSEMFSAAVAREVSRILGSGGGLKKAP